MTIKKSTRAPSGAPTTKWFITAASVAALLGGWVGFSSQSVSEVNAAPQTLAIDLNLEPIPTVMPVPANHQNTILTSDQLDNSQPSLPTLRSVSAPRPAPVTVTRSSH